MPKPKAWVKWRRRALSAERRADALEAMLLEKTGSTLSQHCMIDMGTVLASSPRHNVIITGVTCQEDRYDA